MLATDYTIMNDSKLRLENTRSATCMNQYIDGINQFELNPKQEGVTSFTSRCERYLELPGCGTRPFSVNFNASTTGLIISGISSASHILNNKGARRLISLAFDSVQIDRITYQQIDSEIIKPIGLQNDGIFIFSPYLADGIYESGTTQYTLWRTSQGFTGNKPILDSSVPHAKFMTLTLSEDKKDLILTLTLPDELTV